MNLIKDIAYKTLDVVTQGHGINRHVGGESIRFPPRWSRYYEAEYEPETFRFFHEYLRPGDTVLDIGGHIGLFAVVTARLVAPGGQVFSFEPTPFTRAVLEEVVALNECEDIVEVRSEAVSARSGETVFFDTGDEISNANSLVKTERSKIEIPIKLISVDEFAADRGLKIRCMKIDVEGAEMDVLKGARNTFANDRPVTRLGLHPEFISKNGQSLDEIWEIITEYRMDVFTDGVIASREWFCSQQDLFDVNLLPID